MRQTFRGVLLCIGFFAVGCGGRTPRAEFGGAGVEGNVVEAPGPGATSYDTASSEQPVVGTPSEPVVAGVFRAANGASVTLQGDGRLGILAGWLGERLGQGGEPPPSEVIAFFASHLGIVEPTPHVVVLGQPDPAQLENSVADAVGQFLSRQPYTHWGAAVQTREGLTLVTVVLTSRELELEPVERVQPRDSTLSLHGRLLGSLSNPQLAVTLPNGEVQRTPAGAGPGFEVRLPTGEPGVYRVELLARGPRGESVIANLPVSVGVPAPTSLRLRGEPTEARDATEVEAQLLELLNQARREAGKPPLVASPEIASVARAHSADMAEHDFVEHESPTNGTTAQRVQRANLQSGLILENLGRGYNASEIHRGLMDSPGHRANIVNSDVTHVGIGVVAEEDGGRTVYVVTEVFLRMTRAIDTAQAPAQLLASLNRARAARGAPPLEADENLGRAASDAATQFFADSTLTQQDTVDAASASLRRFAIAYRRVGGLMALVSNVEEAAALEPALDPEVRLVGIGVAQGSRPDTGPNAIGIVIVLGWPR